MFTGIFATILQAAVGAFIIWGLFHEDKLVRLEDRIAAAVRRWAKRRSRRRAPARPPVRAAVPAPKAVVRVRAVRSSRCA